MNRCLTRVALLMLPTAFLFPTFNLKEKEAQLKAHLSNHRVGSCSVSDMHNLKNKSFLCKSITASRTTY